MFRRPSDPGFAVPAGAVDTHVHVFGPAERYPLRPGARTTQPDALLPDLRSILDAVGVTRAVIVHPSPYGTDNRASLDAIAADPVRLRGVAVIGLDTGDEEIARLHAGGMRGVRLNLVSGGGPEGRAPGELVRAMAARVRPFGCHVQVYCKAPVLAEIAPVVAAGLGVDVVFDHMGGGVARLGAGQPGVKELIELLAAGLCWVKLSGAYRLEAAATGDRDVAALARALHTANPERVVWASDWPHTGPRKPDDKPGQVTPHLDLDYGRLLADVAVWFPDQATRARLFVENPARLYGF